MAKIKVRVVQIYSNVYEVEADDFKDAVEKLEAWTCDDDIDVPQTDNYDFEHMFYPASENESAISTEHLEWDE